MRLFATLLLAISAQAFACPNLTGAYTCTYQDGTSEVITVSQAQKGTATDYNYNGSDIVTDNQVYNLPDDDTMKNATFRAWCDGDSLKVQMLGQYYDNGSYFGDITMNLDISLSNNNLHQVTSGALANSGGNYPLNDDITCARNP